MREDTNTAGTRGTHARVLRLGTEPGDDLSAITTPDERVAMVWELTARMWEFGGAPEPTYTRATIPVTVHRA
jgi:hypothetical protein